MNENQNWAIKKGGRSALRTDLISVIHNSKVDEIQGHNNEHKIIITTSTILLRLQRYANQSTLVHAYELVIVENNLNILSTE